MPNEEKCDMNSGESETALNASRDYRYPTILKPVFRTWKSDENCKVFSHPWGLPGPLESRDNTADVIISALHLWTPSAIPKLLDLNVPHFRWLMSLRGSSSHCSEILCVERSSKCISVDYGKRGLSYLLDDDDRWQLRQALCIDPNWTGNPFAWLDKSKSEQNPNFGGLASYDQNLARTLTLKLPWNSDDIQARRGIFCHVSTKKGDWIRIEESETIVHDETLVSDEAAEKEKSSARVSSCQSFSDTDTDTEAMTKISSEPTKVKGCVIGRLWRKLVISNKSKSGNK